MEIRPADLQGPELAALLREHAQTMARQSPAESQHALDLGGLRGADVDVWTLWIDGDLAGCGALKRLDAGHAEIKSMRTAVRHQRRGVAARLLEHMIAEAGRRGYRRLSIETGTADYFAPARALYARFGFAPCAPFGDYVEDPHSAYMSRDLDAAAAVTCG